MFALLSAQQNVSWKHLTGIPAKNAPGLKPTELHTLKDAYLQLRSQVYICWNHTAMQAKILTQKLPSIGITTMLVITNGNDHTDHLFQPWPAKQNRQIKNLIRKWNQSLNRKWQEVCKKHQAHSYRKSIYKEWIERDTWQYLWITIWSSHCMQKEKAAPQQCYANSAFQVKQLVIANSS